MIKVLSIDWDFFIDATLNQRMGWFPDGGNENLPQPLLNYIWISRYSENPIETIEADIESIKTCKQIIWNNSSEPTNICISDSHRFIFDDIKEICESRPGEPVEIWNVDFHHDYYGVSDDVNCGNWVNHIFDKTHLSFLSEELIRQSKYHWVGKEDSDRAKEPINQPWYSRNTLSEMKEHLEGTTFDLIYLCKSGVWSPPHLDKKFEDLGRVIYPNIDSAIVSSPSNPISDRYTVEFQKEVENQRKLRNDLINQMSKTNKEGE